MRVLLPSPTDLRSTPLRISRTLLCQGLAGAPMILVAMAFGAVISAAVPRLRYSLIVSSLVVE